MSDQPESRRAAVSRGSGARVVLWTVLAVVLLLILAVVWVGVRGVLAKGHLERAVSDVSTLRSQLTDADTSAAQQTAKHLEDEASAYVPFFGANLRAVREVAVVVDDVADGAVRPVAASSGDSAQRRAGGRDTDQGRPRCAGDRHERHALAVTSALAPAMLARDGERNYVLLFQNNAELRAGGGNPGAIALLKVQDGSIKLENQASGGRLARPRDVEAEVRAGGRRGPRDGPGDAELHAPGDRAGQLATGDTLTADNAVQLLLSDVYTKYSDPAVSGGGFDAKQFISALTKGTNEGRLRLWSATRTKQQRRRDSFGVYLNDGTGSKMDYYLDKTVSVGSSVCRQDGRRDLRGRGHAQEPAPADAATSLPRYVTGGGDFGTEPGKIKTLVAVYAPENAIYLGSTQDGKQVGVQTATDGGHPVAQLQTLLARGRARRSASRTSATRSSRTPASRRSRRRASSRARSSPCGSSARTGPGGLSANHTSASHPQSGGDGVSSRATRSVVSQS
ncbi:hypothetical protein Pfo_031561, partial [Paulownia fortunei]